MKIAFKPEVRVGKSALANPWVVRILRALAETAPEMFDDLILVSSANDGKHKTGSKHYEDAAFDVRIYGQRPGAIKRADDAGQHASALLWVARLKQYLGKDYDVILEADHIHIEYDPK